MKKILFTTLILIAGVFSSCTQMLMEESKTNITSEWLKSTPEGLEKMIVALYENDRAIIRKQGGEGEMAITLLCDATTDLSVYRAGPSGGLFRLKGVTAEKGIFRTFWNHYYQLIGKANEVISSAEQMDMENPVVKKAWAEAKVFRGRSYFELYKRFERLYLNLEPTTIDNLERDFKPSEKEEIFEVIKKDLDDAIEILPWTDMPGRFTKAVAKHVRAQVAMWEDDWDTTIKECEDIFACSDYGMMEKTSDCFKGGDLNFKENLFVFQFSENIGGGNSTSGGEVSGHRLAINTNVSYHKIAGMKFSPEYGMYGWARVFPNHYLLSLYDQEKDNRYSTCFRTKWYYNDPEHLPAGKKIGDEVESPKTGKDYINTLHPISLKYHDQWTSTTNLEKRTSFKDVVIYRLAETYLMAAEAYFHKEGGASAKALEYYNKTWMRAGNDQFTGTLTLDDILDENARELNFEGVRWSLLKRLNLLERAQMYGGESPKDNPLLKEQTNLVDIRNYFEPKWYIWPIPQAEVDFMGAENFPQNEGWL